MTAVRFGDNVLVGRKFILRLATSLRPLRHSSPLRDASPRRAGISSSARCLSENSLLFFRDFANYRARNLPVYARNADNRNAAGSADTSFGESIDRSIDPMRCNEETPIVDRDGREEEGMSPRIRRERKEADREREREREREGEVGSLKRRDISARFTFSTPFCLPVLPSPAFSLAQRPTRTKKGLARPCESRANMHRERNYAASALRSQGGAAWRGTARHGEGKGRERGRLENLAAHTRPLPILSSSPTPFRLRASIFASGLLSEFRRRRAIMARVYRPRDDRR